MAKSPPRQVRSGSPQSAGKPGEDSLKAPFRKTESLTHALEFIHHRVRREKLRELTNVRIPRLASKERTRTWGTNALQGNFRESHRGKQKTIASRRLCGKWVLVPSDQVGLLHQIERFLPGYKKLISIVSKISIVFHHDVDLLVVPLGNGCLRVQLYGKVRTLAQRLRLGGPDIGALRGAEVNTRSQSMPLVADGMAVDLRLDPFLLHFLHGLVVDVACWTSRTRRPQRERIL